LTLTVTIPLPPRFLSPNARAHWRPKAACTKRYRRDAMIAAKAAMGHAPPPLWKRATLQAAFHHKARRLRDDDNAMGSLKAARDGLADAGVVIDDNGFTVLPPTFAVDKNDPRVVLTITEALI